MSDPLLYQRLVEAEREAFNRRDDYLRKLLDDVLTEITDLREGINKRDACIDDLTMHLECAREKAGW